MTIGAGKKSVLTRWKGFILSSLGAKRLKAKREYVHCRRVDELLTTEAWNKQKEIAAREGIVAIAYERKYGQFSRIYQMAKLMLWSSGAGLYSCPIAMTGNTCRQGR